MNGVARDIAESVRGVMPDESPIDLEEHASLIAEVVWRARVRERQIRSRSENLAEELLAETKR